MGRPVFQEVVGRDTTMCCILTLVGLEQNGFWAIPLGGTLLLPISVAGTTGGLDRKGAECWFSPLNRHGDKSPST